MTRTLLLLAVLIPACAGSPDWSADEASNAIAENLVAGKVDDAEAIFDDIDKSDHHMQAVYATVYERAGRYYRKGRYAEAIVMLRFLRERYGDAEAPRLALLYAHFLQRGEASTPPDADAVKEVRGLVKEIRQKDEKYPWWVDLAAAQNAIDGGRARDAREEYAKFKAKWDGRPAQARFYVEEFERYFATQDRGA